MTSNEPGRNLACFQGSKRLFLIYYSESTSLNDERKNAYKSARNYAVIKNVTASPMGRQVTHVSESICYVCVTLMSCKLQQEQ